MKDRIIIPKDKIKVLTSCGHFPANGYFTFYKEDVEVEQVPESFSELKELCKKTNPKIVNENAMYESQIIIDTDKGYFGFYYYSTGRIDIVFKSAYSTNHTVAKRRTIPQTWAFIKSLIGEE